MEGSQAMMNLEGLGRISKRSFSCRFFVTPGRSMLGFFPCSHQVLEFSQLFSCQSPNAQILLILFGLGTDITRRWALFDKELFMLIQEKSM